MDEYTIGGGSKTRVFESARDAVETVAAPLDDDFSRAIVTHETPTDVGDSYLWVRASGQRTKLTDNKDYAPEFTAAIRKRIEVTRPDGFKFIVNLTLPSDYKAGTRLPAMFWFYPYEYTSQAEYDRTLRTENVNRFPSAGPADDRVSDHAGLRGGQLRPADRGRGRPDERQLRPRSGA